MSTTVPIFKPRYQTYREAQDAARALNKGKDVVYIAVPKGTGFAVEKRGLPQRKKVS